MASLARGTANRALHLRITPRPSNLGESREIMRLISKFGEVEYFKNLRYDTLSTPNAVLVIFKHDEAAKHCVDKSPIRFRMGKAPVEQGEDRPVWEKKTEQNGADVLEAMSRTTSSAPKPKNDPFRDFQQTRSLSTRSLPTPPPREIEIPFISPQPPPQLPSESRVFEIQTNVARVNFRNLVAEAHFHGPFAIDGKSLAQQDLAKSVPAVGLSDINWRAESKPWRVREKEQRREHEGPSRRKTLLEVWEEGESARG